MLNLIKRLLFKPFKLLVKGFGILLLSLTLLTAFSAWQVYDYAQNQQKTHPQTADAVIVLGAAAWGRQPSPVFRERINHAISLYQKGKAKKIIFTGGLYSPNSPESAHRLTEAEVAKRYAQNKFSVPEHDILLDNESNNTFDNLQNSRALMRQHHLESAIIVSDPDHLARAAVMAHHLDMQTQVSATPTSLFYNNRGQRFKFVMQEILSLTAFRLMVLFQAA